MASREKFRRGCEHPPAGSPRRRPDYLFRPDLRGPWTRGSKSAPATGPRASEARAASALLLSPTTGGSGWARHRPPQPASGCAQAPSCPPRLPNAAAGPRSWARVRGPGVPGTRAPTAQHTTPSAAAPSPAAAAAHRPGFSGGEGAPPSRDASPAQPRSHGRRGRCVSHSPGCGSRAVVSAAAS